MSQAAHIRPEVLNNNAADLICQTLRRNILALMDSPVFTRYERVKAKLNLVQVKDAGQLQRYQAGVLRARDNRETAADLSAHYAPTPSTAFDDDEEAFRQQEYDECDRDAA